MIIRRETADDFSRIYDLVKTAFQTAKVSDGKEQDFVTQLRNSGGYIPELALVAEDNGKLIGHIMLTKTHVLNGGDKYQTLLLAPLSVLWEYRGKGIGSALVNESFRLAKEMNFTSVFLVGDPAYYSRFGFKSSITWNIKNTQDIPDEYVMACELNPDALGGLSGKISFETVK